MTFKVSSGTLHLYSLTHQMHETQTIVNDDRGVCPQVCLSRGSTWPHGAKTAQRIKILFGVNTPGGSRNTALHGGPDPPTGRGGDGGSRNIALHGGPDHPQRGAGESGEILPTVDPLHI